MAVEFVEVLCISSYDCRLLYLPDTPVVELSDLRVAVERLTEVLLEAAAEELLEVVAEEPLEVVAGEALLAGVWRETFLSDD